MGQRRSHEQAALRERHQAARKVGVVAEKAPSEKASFVSMPVNAAYSSKEI